MFSKLVYPFIGNVIALSNSCELILDEILKMTSLTLRSKATLGDKIGRRRLLRGVGRRGRASFTSQAWIGTLPSFRTCSRAIQKFHQARGRPKVAVRITVADLTAEWLKTYVRNARNPYNVKQTESRVERFLNPFMGPKQAPKVGPDDLRRYRLWVEKHQLTPTSASHSGRRAVHVPLGRRLRANRPISVPTTDHAAGAGTTAGPAHG